MNDPLFKTLALMSALGMVEIHNARAEFACNSSSSHSVLVLPSAPDATTDSDEDFAGDITIVDSSTKIRYLAALLSQMGEADLAKTLRSTIKEWKEYDTVEAQSPIRMPLDRFDSVSREFVLELSDFLRRPEVAIIGGEDVEGDHFLARSDGAFFLDLPRFDGWYARRDQIGERSWWVLFNPEDGTKLRMSFKDPAEGFTPTKAQLPELVDVKVTDRCPFELDCGFCYMGSTRDGVEAKFEDVRSLLISLSQMGVFEIAFGGGEPTLWPHFVDTVALTRSLGMVPNFTSKNFKVLRNETLMDLAGAVAFSVTDRRSFERFAKEFAVADAGRFKAALQVIPEILPDDLIEDIFRFAKENWLRLTLLGYKTTGRGDQFDGRIKRSAGFWVPIAKRYPNLRLSIDTTLAAASEDVLISEGVPSWSYHTSEGTFSMYCDAVLNAVSASSYIEPSEFDKVDFASPDLTAHLSELFKGY